MKIAIRYYTKSGNTRKLAEAIGRAIGVAPEDISNPLTEDVDLLFLGSSVYKAGVDKAVKRFISDLDVKVGKIVNFSSAALISGTYRQVKKLAAARGIVMADEEFHCKGSFHGLFKSHPDTVDLKNAGAFAENVVAGGK